MSLEHEICELGPCQFPPPSNTILSNLANQLLIDETFYVEILKLAKQFGYSGIYQRKVIVHPNVLNCYNNSNVSSDNLESLGGYFRWIRCNDLEQEQEKGNSKSQLNTAATGSSSVRKTFWCQGRKDAYNIRAFSNFDDFRTAHKTPQKNLRNQKKTVKIKIDGCNLNYLSSTSSTKELADKKDSANLHLKYSKDGVSNALKKSDTAALCKIERSDYELFPIFKNYKEGQPGNKLYVKNISKKVELQDLRNIFEPFVTPSEGINIKEKFNIRFFERGKLRRQVCISRNKY